MKTCTAEILTVFGSKNKVCRFRSTCNTNLPLALERFATRMLNETFNVQMPEGEMMPVRCAMDWLQENDWIVTVK